jgi:UDP-GlcNAc:undecaprenyl-phosphate GlcNAc-1-phosphate transferase
MNAVAGYAGVLLAAFALTGWLTPVARRVAQRRGLVDAPGARKVQDAAVPLLGGLAMALGFSAVLLAAGPFLPSAAAQRELATALGLAMAVLLLGLIDDVRGLTPLARLLFEGALGTGVWAAGLGIGLTGLGPLNLAMTVVWVVAVTNAFNLLDNMDGLSSSVATVAALWFLVIAGVNGQFLVALMAAATAGCALGFLDRKSTRLNSSHNR